MKLEKFAIKDWIVLGKTEFLPPKKITDELLDEARIIHVVNGNSHLYSANKDIKLTKGDTLIMKTDNFINTWQENGVDENTIVIVFQLTAALLQFLYNNDLPHWFIEGDKKYNQSLVKVEDHPLIASYYNSLQLYIDNNELFSEDIVTIKIKELISILINTDNSGETKNIFGNLFTAKEYEFKETIAKNIFEDLNIEDLAFLCSLSTSSFKRKFQTVYGTSPNKYITSKRLDKAQTLLKTTNLTISEVAYDCGFSDVSYFSKSYKKYYNSSPSELRK
ncbi:AraC family transcriptional regulator [Flammeovirga kamogawensis]|uniref:AraC family transcriptional regulator n=1 Tax=Flammeovirga kamogawensis TaxID=373891 RepID=A0ABX8H205_9BACT|nr:helix-turn-helix domain-containing protein [Flammeovirga kamogawensis]MBB6463750.1 AraC-like DNA-binding protein [Flammeovirga kamogawensis]QWG09738.1 AraC family transcriptional regulator [Flammeovirga kamogawensis]TRX65251.1 AraC family transcriptional regulator [Flammeovirga kamogawensis]